MLIPAESLQSLLFDELGETHFREACTHKLSNPRCMGLEKCTTDTHKVLFWELCQFSL